jgi:hypothetical protein
MINFDNLLEMLDEYILEAKEPTALDFIATVAPYEIDYRADDVPEQISKQLARYIKYTEIPILSDFCTKINAYEEFIYQLANTYSSTSKEIQHHIKTLKNKKNAALERKIYENKLNSTAAGHYLKIWHEEKPELVEIPEYTQISASCLYDIENELGFTKENTQLFAEICRALGYQNNMEVVFKPKKEIAPFQKIAEAEDE